MKVIVLIFTLILIGCKNPEPPSYDHYEYRERMEEEIMESQRGQGSYIDFNDNIENELRGTEEELMRMNKLNDSLLDELYKCRQSQ